MESALYMEETSWDENQLLDAMDVIENMMDNPNLESTVEDLIADWFTLPDEPRRGNPILRDLGDQDTDLDTFDQPRGGNPIIRDVSFGNPIPLCYGEQGPPGPDPDILHNYAAKQHNDFKAPEIWDSLYDDNPIYYALKRHSSSNPSRVSTPSPTPSDMSNISLLDMDGSIEDYMAVLDAAPAQVTPPPATNVRQHQAARQPAAAQRQRAVAAQQQSSVARHPAAPPQRQPVAARQPTAVAQKQTSPARQTSAATQRQTSAARQPAAAAHTVAPVCAAPNRAVCSATAAVLHAVSGMNHRRPLTKLPAAQTHSQLSSSGAPAKRRGRPPANLGLEHDYSRKPPQKQAARRGAPKKAREPKVTKSKISKDKHNANERERRKALRDEVNRLQAVIREGTELGAEAQKKLSQSKSLVLAAQAISILTSKLVAAGLDPNAVSHIDLK